MPSDDTEVGAYSAPQRDRGKWVHIVHYAPVKSCECELLVSEENQGVVVPASSLFIGESNI